MSALFVALALAGRAARRSSACSPGGIPGRALGAAGELPPDPALHRRGGELARRRGGRGALGHPLRSPSTCRCAASAPSRRPGKIQSLWVGVENVTTACAPAIQDRDGAATRWPGAGTPPLRSACHLGARPTGRSRDKLVEWVQAHNLFRAPPVPIEHFTLFSSQLGKESPVYTAEVDYALA